jgi:hypothetical protein
MASPPGAPTIGTDGVSSAICCRRARACRARRAGSTDMCALRPAWRARRYLLARWARARACSERATAALRFFFFVFFFFFFFFFVLLRCGKSRSSTVGCT